MKQVRAIGDREGEGFGKALPTLEVQEGGRKQAEIENDSAKHCHAFLPIFPIHIGAINGIFVQYFGKKLLRRLLPLWSAPHHAEK